MPRRKRATKKVLLADPIYNSTLITKFVNRLMIKGKKSVVFRLFYGALDIVGAKSGKEPLEVFKKAVNNVRPLVETKSRRIGGANYQIPIEVKEDRSYTLAIRWMVAHAQSAPGKTLSERLAHEFMNAFNNTGETIKKRDTVHKQAEANKAFAHFRMH